MLGLQVYQQWGGWKFGPEPAHPDFQSHSMKQFHTNVGAVARITIAHWFWIWITRDRHIADDLVVQCALPQAA
jgi:hypothetical protein